MSLEPPSFVHLFQSFVNYQKNVLHTLVAQKLESTASLKHISSEKTLDMINSNSDSDAEDDSVEHLFQFFADKMNGGCKINILCSHVTHNDLDQTGIKFPFIQYMLEKPAFNHHQFTLPSLFITDISEESESLETQVTNYVSQMYRSVFPGMAPLTVENSYVGACHLGDQKDIYVLLDVSRVWTQIDNAGLSSNNQAWFVLPSEIINARQVCNMVIDDSTTRLFAEYPELSKLQSTTSHNHVIPVPDVGYTVSPDIYASRLACMFGPPKTVRYSNHDEVCDAGFAFSAEINADAHVAKAVTRYAVFYNDEELIHDYDLFLPLTFHILNTSGEGIM